MGFLSGLGNLFGIGGGSKQAKNASRNAKWLPPSLNLNGANASMTMGDPKKNIPFSFNTSLSPQQQALYDSLGGLANSAIGQLTASQGAPAVPGYAGITPELYNEFNLSNQYSQSPYGSVGNIYQPNISNMGQVRGTSFDASGLPQVGYQTGGVPSISYNASNLPSVSYNGQGMGNVGMLSYNGSGMGNVRDANYNGSGMGSVRNASYDGSGMGSVRGVTYDGSGMPSVAGGFDASGMPKAGAGVNWSGKAEGLDQAYLDKSKAFLNASNPVTGFDGVAKDWYDSLTKLSQNDQNNMLAGAGDKAFLSGMLGAQTGNGYNPTMKAAFDAYNDADLQNKMAGYQVGADASQRNLNQALQAGGYVQQNDQTRLQQAMAQGQLDAQTSIANQQGWLSGQGMGIQARGMDANNWLANQGLGLQAQGMNQDADRSNVQNWLANQGLGIQVQGMNQAADQNNIGNWLANQGMGLQAQGMNQNADAQNIQNWLANQGLGLQAGMANQGAQQNNIANWLANQGMGLQAQQYNAGNWLSGQGLGIQAQQSNASNYLADQGLGQAAQMANAGNWLSGQGLNLQSQGMNQNADMQNIANYLQAQGMLTDASGMQSNRDLAVNSQALQQNQFNFDRANQRFANAQNMFGLGQNTLNAEQQRIMQMLAAGAGGMQSYDQYLMNMLGMQGDLGSAQSGANLGAGGLRTNYDLTQQGIWGSMFSGASEGAASAATTAAISSDRRLKTNIEQIGTTPAGYPWYSFDYVWGTPGEGVMADEVPEDWVKYGADGFATVDYSKVK